MDCFFTEQCRLIRQYSWKTIGIIWYNSSYSTKGTRLYRWISTIIRRIPTFTYNSQVLSFIIINASIQKLQGEDSDI